MIGVRGRNERGDIAVDDILFIENSYCGVQPPEVLLELTETTLNLFSSTKHAEYG